jgi:hypothetical protein
VGAGEVSDVAKASDRQSAVRLLACIDAASVPVTDDSWGPEVIAVLHAQSRLQALDFWMRNPDYLANELLNEFETSGEQALLDLAQRIFDDRDPDLRRLPMIRYHFGAFEPLDNALAILRAADLIMVRRSGAPGQVREHHYLLTQKGRIAMDTLASSAAELAWYRERGKLVARVAGATGGAALKDRQYLQREYAQTEHSRVIGPVAERVRARLATILEGQSG